LSEKLKEEGLLGQWKLLAKSGSDVASLVNKIESDLKTWAGSEEHLLQSVRARAVSKMEERSTIMVIDARLKELGEFKKAVLGH